jgi:hypothetical protein
MSMARAQQRSPLALEMTMLLGFAGWACAASGKAAFRRNQSRLRILCDPPSLRYTDVL